MLAPALALVAVLAGAPHHRLVMQPNLSMSGGAGGSSGALFQFAPSSGVGLASTATLCDSLTTAQKVGNWWCLDGTGAMATGSVRTLSASGTPVMTATSVAVCPNGPSCATASVLRGEALTGVAGRGGYESTAVPAPAGAWTVCQHSMIASYGGVEQNLFSQAETGASITSLWQTNAANTGVLVYTGGVARRTVTITPKAWHLLCVTSNAAQTTGQAYLDGATSGATFTPTLGAFGSQSMRVSGYGDGTFSHAPATLTAGTFFVEAELSAAEVATLARAVLADTPKGSRGEAMTFTRASAMTCPGDTDSEVTTVPVDRPCITRDGIYSEPAATSLLLRSEQLENASWVEGHGGGSSATVVTANSADVAAPDGTITAEKLVIAASTNAGDYSRVYQSVSATAVAYSFSVWLRTASGSASVNIGIGNGAGVIVGFTRCAVTTTWSRCKVENITLTVASYFPQIGTDLFSSPVEAATSAATVYAWGAQFELGSFASSYIPTTSSSATRAVTVGSFTKPSTFSDTAGCLAATLTSDGAPAANARFLAFAGNTQSLYMNSATSLSSHDGTNTLTNAAVSSIVGRSVTAIQTWTGVAQTLIVDGVTTSGTYDGAVSAATFNVGSFGSANQPSGIIKDVRMSTRTTGCQ